jgi:enoyl-CoA hydratase/carnithine racemase
MSTEHILTDLADGILTIRLNRPEKKNALTQAMYTALADAFKRADEDPAVRRTASAAATICRTFSICRRRARTRRCCAS